MIEENMLRGSLTSTQEAKGGLGFKGERGYSNYEIYVKNGGTMTEEEWLEHFGVDLTGYAKTSEVEEITGDLENLETIDKTDIVSAINEHQGSIDALDERGIYSENEKKVGVWIDGKPIYRKVVTSSFTSFEALTINLNINNLKRIYSISGVITNIPESGGEGNVFIFPSYRGPGGTTGIQVFGANTSNGAIVTITPESDRTGYDVICSVEYTKTTD